MDAEVKIGDSFPIILWHSVGIRICASQFLPAAPNDCIVAEPFSAAPGKQLSLVSQTIVLPLFLATVVVSIS